VCGTVCRLTCCGFEVLAAAFQTPATKDVDLPIDYSAAFCDIVHNCAI